MMIAHKSLNSLNRNNSLIPTLHYTMNYTASLPVDNLDIWALPMSDLSKF